MSRSSKPIECLNGTSVADQITRPLHRLHPTATKKVVLRLECTVCKYRSHMALKRCKHFELGGDKKQKGAALVF